MNEIQYRLLCSECDKILELEPKLMAIEWLHIRREHPETISKYNILFNSYKAKWYKGFIATLLIRFFRVFGGLLVRICLSLLQPKQVFYEKIINKKINILFVSHFISESQLSSNEDFYFSDLPSSCQSDGLNVAVALIDHIGNSSRKSINNFNKEIPLFQIPPRGSPWLEIKMTYQALKLFGSILRIPLPQNNFKRRLLFCTAVEVFSGATYAALRIKHHVNNIIEITKPKTLIMTWEGFSWERLLVGLTKEKNYKIKSVGYQHSILSRLQHASCRRLGNKFDPDSLWVSGLSDYERFLKSKLCTPSNLAIVGNNKIPDFKNKKKINVKNLCVLVVPEGLTSECSILFHYSLRCALMFPQISFIWRLHPSLNFNQLFKDFPSLKNIPKTITISTKNIDKDIERVTHVLYRGSSTVIKAVSLGVQPIYLNLPNEMTIDPIHNLKHWKLTVNKPEDLKLTINNQSKLEIQNRYHAIEYAKSFFMPMDKRKILKIIKND